MNPGPTAECDPRLQVGRFACWAASLLTISGERKFEDRVKEENYLRVERSYGSFSRSFSLPTTVNTEAIKAEYKNGVLTVELPKRAESKPKQVKINVTNSKN